MTKRFRGPRKNGKAVPTPKPKVKCEVQMIEQKIRVSSPEEAERLRVFLAAGELDTMVFVPNAGWTYIRRRCMAKMINEPPKKGAGSRRQKPTNEVPPDDNDTQAS